MSASTPSGGREATENELLAQLGLPPSASPEDVDHLHLAVSQYLAAAPSSIRGWAHAQAAQLDEAYLSLTDPVGLEGSALRSPTRPPTVVPGGPATPPARRDPIPAAATGALAAEAAAADVAATAGLAVAESAAIDDTDTDDEDALYASVTPGAHRDLTSGGKTPKPNALAAANPEASTLDTASPSARRAGRSSKQQRAATPMAASAPANSGPWKLIAIGASALLAVVVVVGFVVPFVFSLSSGATAAAAPTGQSAASGSIDMAQVAALMQKITTNPKDTDSLQQLGDLYYQASDYTNAASFYDKVLAVDPKNVKGLLARGAVYFNTGDLVSAKKSWDAVLVIDPKNVEAHYDLGFLAMNQASPDWAAVQKEWQTVIALDPGSTVATTVQQHLDALVKASMIPAPSGAAGASGAPAASGASGSAAPSSAPSASAPSSPAPSGSTAP